MKEQEKIRQKNTIHPVSTNTAPRKAGIPLIDQMMQVKLRTAKPVRGKKNFDYSDQEAFYRAYFPNYEKRKLEEELKKRLENRQIKQEKKQAKRDIATHVSVKRSQQFNSSTGVPIEFQLLRNKPKK
jgi:hypothetical protein